MSPELPVRVVSTVETLTADKPFQVEIVGPLNAGTAVIMVHGFGVKRDSRRLFTDVENVISDKVLSVRAEFSDVLTNGTETLPFSVQAERLKVVLEYVKKRFGNKKIVLVGHSQGNLVIAAAKPAGVSVFLLAPPAEFEKFTQSAGWKKPDSHLDISGTSILSRSDLQIEVGPEFWAEFISTDPSRAYSELAADNQVEFIVPGNDAELGSDNLPTEITHTQIPSASHDFGGSSRELLIKELKALIID
jgi:pimeloyl-ACP methyl ester carboxylesterase